MAYLQVSFNPVQEESPVYDLLVGELTLVGCTDFWNQENELIAYFEQSSFNAEEVNLLAQKYNLTFSTQVLEEINWNEQWEKSFSPVEIGNDVLVRAPFHEAKKNFKHEIIIEPKMSFGSGHHETTQLMIENMLELDFTNKSIIDAGCGTGILAILAAKLGAEDIFAYDINEWAYNNTLENIQSNKTQEIRVIMGDARCLNGCSTDILLANINRNILLADIPAFEKALNPGGYLIMSGFLEKDLDLIRQKAQEVNLRYQNHKQLGDWISAIFIK